MLEANVVSLKRQIKKLEAKVKDLKNLLKDEEMKLLAEWTKNGISKTTIDGSTIYVSRKLWAGGDTEELVKALEDAGLGDLVKPGVNRNTLTAWVKEVTEARPTMTTDEVHAALPEEMKEAIEITEKVTIGMREA